MASLSTSDNNLMKQDVPIMFDAIFSPGGLDYCHNFREKITLSEYQIRFSIAFLVVEIWSRTVLPIFTDFLTFRVQLINPVSPDFLHTSISRPEHC